MICKDQGTFLKSGILTKYKMKNNFQNFTRQLNYCKYSVSIFEMVAGIGLSCLVKSVTVSLLSCLQLLCQVARDCWHNESQ